MNEGTPLNKITQKPVYHRLFYFICLLLAMSSCGKEKIDLVWEERMVNNTSPLTAVFFTNENTGHIIGGDTWYQGYYLSTTDGGDTWLVDSLTNKKMNGLQFLEDGYGVCVGIDGYLFRKETPEAPWNFLRLPRYDVLRDVAYKNRNEGMVVGGIAYGFGVIMRLDNNNVTQIDTFENELAAICYSTDSTAHALGFGIVLRSDDSGQSWQRLDIDGDFFRAVDFPSPEVGYAVGSGGTILKTTDGGRKWDKIRKGEKIGVKNVPFRDLHFIDEVRGYLVGEDGTFWRTANGGDNWQVVDNFPGVDLLGVHIVGDQGWVVSEEGRLFWFLVE